MQRRWRTSDDFIPYTELSRLASAKEDIKGVSSLSYLMTLCFVTHLTLTICFSEAWLALQWAVTDSTKHSKQWGMGQLRGLEQKRERELAWFRNMWLLKYLSFIAWKHLNASLFFSSSSLCHLLPESPLPPASLSFPSHSSISLFPPSSVRWTVSARFVSLYCLGAGDVGAAGSCFKLSFPEMFEGTSRVLSVPVTLSGRGKELELPGRSLSHQWTNDSLFELRSGGSYRPPPFWIIFCTALTQTHTCTCETYHASTVITIYMLELDISEQDLQSQGQ